MAKGKNFLFLGPEIGEKQDALDALKKELTKASGTPLEIHSFYASESDLGDVVSLLRNSSLFSDSRLVLLKSAAQIKKKEDVELLLSYLRNPQEDTTLILLSDESSIDKRLDVAFDKESKRIFWELFESRKTEWVASFFRREGFKISDAGIETILELVENNTDALRRECGRLSLFLDRGSLVGEAEVEACLSHTREESAFSLFSRLADGDLSKALESERTLLAAKEAPPAIVAGLLWCFRRLDAYLGLVSSGRLNDFELKKAGLASKKAQKDYQAAARRYTAQSVRRCIALLAEFDVLFRSSTASFEDILMDLLILKLASPSPQSFQNAEIE